MKVKIIFYLFIFGIMAFPAKAQEKWTVSDDEKALSSPLPITDDLIDQGQDLFIAKCQSCHGPAGKGKALPLVPDMKDLGNPSFLKSVTAGEMFTKLTEGKGAMPSFKSQISKEERWKIVDFLRSLIGERGTKQKKAASSSNVEYQDLSLSAKFDKASHSLDVKLKAKDAKGNEVSPIGVKVKVLVKRYFGNLLLATVKTTEGGVCSVEIPADLPVSFADSSLTVIAKLKNVSKYGKLAQTIKVKWGAPNPHVNLLAHRSLWTTMRMAPLWLIFIYFSVVSGVWIFIIYVLTLVAKINKLGKKEETID